MAATSPGLWPVSRISFKAGSSLGHRTLISASDKIRSRSEVGFRSTPWHGLTATISCFTAQEKIARGRGQGLVGDDRGLDRGHHQPDVGAGDRVGLQLSPPGEEVSLHQALGLLPTLVVLLGVKLDVLAGEVGEGPGVLLGPPLGHWVLALGDVEHHPGGEPPGVGEADVAGIAEVEPPGLGRCRYMTFHAFLPGGPDREGQVGAGAASQTNSSRSPAFRVWTNRSVSFFGSPAWTGCRPYGVSPKSISPDNFQITPRLNELNTEKHIEQKTSMGTKTWHL